MDNSSSDLTGNLSTLIHALGFRRNNFPILANIKALVASETPMGGIKGYASHLLFSL